MMIDNPRFRGMTLPQARKLERESEGFRDLSDEQVWALRMVYAHDCTERPAEPDPAAALVANLEQLDKMFPGHVRELIGPDLCDRLLAALAERPAEPDPDPEEALVAAFMAEEVTRVGGSWERPSRPEAERMAAVAQARIDAAVNADRARIRLGLGELLGQAPTGAPYTFMRDALAVVDRDTGGQR